MAAREDDLKFKVWYTDEAEHPVSEIIKASSSEDAATKMKAKWKTQGLLYQIDSVETLK